mmetsp:Transcript_29826/g.28522  ORF Transcript_29826/g.28522 Transcript_29826/m.28522 type:complete len:287 (+) Transcript_29826:158-1018(+)|eukprot:CAMPEP_0119034134 /NCGR_PEP_ID=MMETSP1177-20130426/1163_1 /TAXON_ID=2985 /ORGANISM="Ochromonas sp, Strain CCMP1899" /LENGTH=286 /DNA_ID=CAMNT_0006991377 /DNA_START=157 /DNA_END=1017 /DNA_ORIENTATION=+
MNALGLNSYASDEELENEDQLSHKKKGISGLSSERIDQIDAKIDEDNRELMAIDDFLEETKIEATLLSNNNISESVIEVDSLVSKISEIPAIEVEESGDVSYNRLKELPLPSNKSPNPKTVDKISEYLELKEINGFNLTENIRGNKNFGNPYIFGKAVEHFQIDEIGSNYPQALFDPHGYREIDFEANIKKRYSNAIATTSVKISSTTATIQPKPKIPVSTNQKPPLIPGGQIKTMITSTTEAPKKRSRWDSSNSLEVLGKAVTEAASLVSRSSTGTLTTATNTRI